MLIMEEKDFAKRGYPDADKWLTPESKKDNEYMILMIDLVDYQRFPTYGNMETVLEYEKLCENEKYGFRFEMAVKLESQPTNEQSGMGE